MLREKIQDSISSGVKRLATFSFKEKKRRTETIISALDHVSFEIKHGDSVGIIGANGAGNTTILQNLARDTAPTDSMIRIRGRVGSLQEVGT